MHNCTVVRKNSIVADYVGAEYEFIWIQISVDPISYIIRLFKARFYIFLSSKEFEENMINSCEENVYFESHKCCISGAFLAHHICSVFAKTWMCQYNFYVSCILFILFFYKEAISMGRTETFSSQSHVVLLIYSLITLAIEAKRFAWLVVTLLEFCDCRF